MADRVISVEIGNTLTRVSEVDSGKQVKVHNTFTMPTPDGVVRELGVEPTEEFVSAFKRAMSSKGIKTKKVIFSLNSTRIASREVTIPYVKENKILDIVRANLADYFPIDVTQYVFSHSIISKLYDGNIVEEVIDEVEEEIEDIDEDVKGKKKSKGKAKKAPKAKAPKKQAPKSLAKPTGYKLLLLAAPKNLMGSYERLASALDLTVVSMDYSGNSLYNAAKDACGEGTQMIVKIDDSSSNIMILENGSIALTRSIPYGVFDAYTAIMDSESFGDIKTLGKAIALTKAKTVIYTDFAEADEVSFEDAPAPEQSEEDELDFLEDLYDAVDVRDTKKRKPTKKSDLVQVEKKDITEALRPTIGGITRVLDFYNSSHGDAPVEKLIITGMGADFAGLSTLLGNEAGLKVRKLGNIGHLDATKVFRDATFGEYVTCIGAAIAPVSFYPDKDETNKKVGGKTDPVRAGVLVLILGVVATGAMVAYSLIPYLSAKKQNDNYNRTISELQPSIDVYNQYLSEMSNNETLHSMDDATVNRNYEFAQFIADLETDMPSTFLVENMTADKDTVNINATVSTKEEVAAVIDKLSQFKSFVDVEVTSSQKVENYVGETVYAISITLYYAPMDYEYTEEEVE